MTLTLPKIQDPRFASLFRNIDPVKKEEFDAIIHGLKADEGSPGLGFIADYKTSDILWTFTEQVRKAVAGIWQALEVNHVVSDASVAVAMCRVVTSADNLSTTDVANDTLTAISQTDVEFDFTDGRRFTTIVLSPGRGVQPLSLRLDTIVSVGQTDWPQSVYAVDSTKLKLVRWDGSSWESLSFDTDWTLDIVQIFSGDLANLPTGD
jgi:hypothetical protein